MSKLEGIKQKSKLRRLEGTWNIKRGDRLMEKEEDDGEENRM